MSRFQIVPKNREEELLEGTTVLMTGLSMTAYQKDPLLQIKSGGKIKFITGLNKHAIERNPYLSPEDKDKFKVEFDQDMESLLKVFRKEDLDEFNEDFWKNKFDLELDAGSADILYDTEADPKHALIKWAIIGGGYQAVAPTYDAANQRGTEYYMVTVDEKEAAEEKRAVGKMEVFAKFKSFLDKASKPNLVWFAWALDKTTQGYTEASSKGLIIDQITDFIDGKSVKGTTKKKVLEIADKTLDLFTKDIQNGIMQGLFNAAQYHGIIYTKDGVFTTINTKLKSTAEASLEMLKDPSLRDELVEIKNEVDKILKK